MSRFLIIIIFFIFFLSNIKTSATRPLVIELHLNFFQILSFNFSITVIIYYILSLVYIGVSCIEIKTLIIRTPVKTDYNLMNVLLPTLNVTIQRVLKICIVVDLLITVQKIGERVTSRK
jgi:hypothetical protein